MKWAFNIAFTQESGPQIQELGIARIRRMCALFSMTLLLAANGCHPVAEPIAKSVKLPYCAGPRRTESRTYMVFFDQHSAVVGVRSKTVIEGFVASLERERSYYDEIATTIIPGKDTSEVLSRDRGLDLRRGQAIERLLRSLAPYARIDIRPHGTDHSPLPTDAFTPEPQNRSAYLIFVGGKQIRPFAWQADCMDWLRSHHCDTALDAAQTAVCKQVEKVAHEFQE